MFDIREYAKELGIERSTKYRNRLNYLTQNSDDFCKRFGKTEYGRYLDYYSTKVMMEKNGLDQNVVAPNYIYLDQLIDNRGKYIKQYGKAGYNYLFDTYKNKVKSDIDNINKVMGWKNGGRFSADLLNSSTWLKNKYVYDPKNSDDVLAQGLNYAPSAFDQETAREIVSFANKIKESQKTPEESSNKIPISELDRATAGNRPVTEAETREAMKVINEYYGFAPYITPEQVAKNEALITAAAASGQYDNWMGTNIDNLTPQQTQQLADYIIKDQTGKAQKQIGNIVGGASASAAQIGAQVGASNGMAFVNNLEDYDKLIAAEQAKLDVMKSGVNPLDPAWAYWTEIQKQLQYNPHRAPTIPGAPPGSIPEDIDDIFINTPENAAIQATRVQQLKGDRPVVEAQFKVNDIVKATTAKADFSEYSAKGKTYSDNRIEKDKTEYFRPVGVDFLVNILSEDEQATYNYLLAHDKEDGTDNAKKFLEDLQPITNARNMQQTVEGSAKFAKEHPVLASLYSIAQSPWAGLGYVTGGARSLLGMGDDPNAPYYTMSRQMSTMRGQVASDIKNAVGGFGGDALSFAYQTGMSVGDFLVTAGISKGLSAAGTFSKASENAALGIMGLNSATSATLDAYDRGATEEQALTAGFWAGVAEIAGEKFSLDNYIKLTTEGRAKFFINLLTQGGIEGSEELGTAVANLVTDNLVMGDLSNYRIAIKNYVDDGLSPEAAENQASLDALADIGLQGLGGLLSGGAVGASAIVIGDIQGGISTDIDSKEGNGHNINDNNSGSKKIKSTEELLKETTCSSDDLYRYIKNIDKNAAEEYFKNGKWPDGVQIPKSPDVLDTDGKINWLKVPKGGYILDSNGNAIKQSYTPFVGEVIDRFGPSNGRYTSPVKDGKSYSYDERSLPFVEDDSQYHQYEVIGDFTKLEEYVKNCSDNALKSSIYEYVNIYYEGDFSKITVYQGKIAGIDGWGIGGGVQYELPMKIEWLESLGILKEI